jgi:hypothetical protein
MRQNLVNGELESRCGCRDKNFGPEFGLILAASENGKQSADHNDRSRQEKEREDWTEAGTAERHVVILALLAARHNFLRSA